MLLGLGIPLIYLVIMGVLMPVFHKHSTEHCGDCNNTGYYSRCHKDHGSGAFFQSLFWFVGLPAYLSSKKLDGPSRVERKRAKEIAKAEHEAELARIAAKTTRDLEIANGIVQASPEKVESARRALGEDYSYGVNTSSEDFLELEMLDAQARKPKSKGGRVWHVSD